MQSVDRIVIPVSHLSLAASFYADTLSFVPDEPGASSGLVLRLGKETIELVQRAGRAVPADSRSNDGWFQHVAIVVSDIDRAYARVLRADAVPARMPPALGFRSRRGRSCSRHVRITTLHAVSGPGIELLDYLTPRDGRPMPADTSLDDLCAEEIVLHAADVTVAGERQRDPDGHALRFVGARGEALR